MVSDLDPTGARCSAEYVLYLRSRREAAGLTYRQLARRARQTQESLPPSTVATMLHRNTLPSRDLVARYIRACGGDDGEVAAWLDARTRLAMAAVVAAPIVDVPRGAGGPGDGVGADGGGAVAGAAGGSHVEVTAATHHHAAVRLFMACGFQIEGLRRGSLTVDGRAVDEYYLGLLLG